MAVPTEWQIELFRVVEDIHEMTNAVVVLLVDADGIAISVAGDDDEIPVPLRRVLSGKALAEAGSVVALLSPIARELARSALNVSVYDVDGSHLLAILFDSEADFENVQTVGSAARPMVAQILAARP